MDGAETKGLIVRLAIARTDLVQAGTRFIVPDLFPEGWSAIEKNHGNIGREYDEWAKTGGVGIVKIVSPASQGNRQAYEKL